jgi:hypothetical protein
MIGDWIGWPNLAKLFYDARQQMHVLLFSTSSFQNNCNQVHEMVVWHTCREMTFLELTAHK